jgi:hypothetical protein
LLKNSRKNAAKGASFPREKMGWRSSRAAELAFSLDGGSVWGDTNDRRSNEKDAFFHVGTRNEKFRNKHLRLT